MRLSSEEYLVNFFYNQQWPDLLFVNKYPIIAVFWNILLVFIAYWICLYLIKLYDKDKKLKSWLSRLAFVLLSFLWLLFAPNSAYIITDMRHISDFCPNTILRICVTNAWMIVFFFVYAVIGWVSFVYLINQMKSLIQKIKGAKWGFAFTVVIIPLMALGVLLGLVDRWNSWDIFISPGILMKDLYKYFSNLLYIRNWLSFSLGFYVLYYAGNYLFDFRTGRKTRAHLEK